MENYNVTSADAVLYMTIDGLYPQGFKLEQFGQDAVAQMADDIFAETRMSVDGHMVAGYVDQIKPVTLTFEPSSPTIPYLRNLQEVTRAERKPYPVMLMVTLPSVGRTYTFVNGVLKQGKQMPDIGKTLQPVQFVFDFERVVG